MSLLRVIEGVDDIAIIFRHRRAVNLRAGGSPIVADHEFAIEDRETLHGLPTLEMRIDLRHLFLDRGMDLGMLVESGVAQVPELALLHPGPEQCRVEHQQHGATFASVLHRDGLRDVGDVRGDRTLDFLRDDVFATRSLEQALLAVDDGQVTLDVELT